MSRITASGKQLIIREHELLRAGTPELKVHKILDNEFKNSKAILHREHQLINQGVPELKVHQIVFNEFSSDT